MNLETRGQHALLGQLVTCTYSDPFVGSTGLFEWDDPRVCSNTTVGWLIEYAEDIVRVAAETADEDAWRWVTTIPTVIVTELAPLERRAVTEEAKRDTAAATAARTPAAGQAPGRG